MLFSLYWLTTCISSFQNCLLKFFAHFSAVLIWFLSCWAFVSCWYILVINPLLNRWFAKDYAHPDITCRGWLCGVPDKTAAFGAGIPYGLVSVLVTPLPIQLSAIVSGKSVMDGPCFWALYSHGRPWRSFWLLALDRLSSGISNHLGVKSANGRPLSFAYSLIVTLRFK